MIHARQQIRDAIAATVDGIAPHTYASRVYPVITFPIIAVATPSEASDEENNLINARRRYSRLLRVDVTILVETVTGFDDTADDLAGQVEAAIEADRTLGGLVTDILLTGTTIDLDGGGDQPLATLTLTYRVWYRTESTTPDTPL